MSHYKPYLSYKDSGVEWLGDVPEHWDVKRLRHVANLNPPVRTDVMLDDEVSFLPMEAIGTDGSICLEKTRFVAEVRTGYSYFENGDVTFAKVTPCFENGKGALMRGLIGGVGFGTTELTVIRPSSKSDASFINYLIQSERFRSHGASAMLGAGGLKRVPDEFTRNFEATWPKLIEQKTIAAHLDRETTRIDALVSKKTRFIELLREKRQALITHAVTKGLNSTVDMTDSGIEWLGKVPTHWRVKKLKYLCKIQTGNKDTVDAEEEGQYPFFVRSQTIERINSYTEDCEAVLTAGDGVGVGKVFHYFEGKFDFHQRVYMLNRFSEISGRFFFHYLQCNFYKVALDGGAKSTVDSLRLPVFLNFQMTVPPADEQVLILDFIEMNTVRIDTIISKTERSIELLKERRSALITAAVTGQIDLREAAKC